MDPFDCEALRAVVPRQPVNVVSSLAFLVAAGALWRGGHRLPALALGTAGVGSVLFHAEPSVLSSWIHDIGLVVTLVVAAVRVRRRLVDRNPPWAAAVLFGSGGVVWAFSRTGGVLCDPASVLQGHAVWHALAAMSFVMLYGPYPRRRAGAP